jgi:hypothetical protein
MNAESAHLDLEELLAEVNGEAVSDLAREHLAACGRCHADALRWGTVAGGVRELMTVSSPLPALVRPPAQAGRKPRAAIAAAAAAAVLVLGGAGYGLTAALTAQAASPAGTSTNTAALTAVSGCTSLKETSGTLAQMNGTSLVIKTASGQPVTVTTTASTMVSVSGAPLGDITNGASIAVAGPSSDGTIAATHAMVGWPQSDSKTLRLPGGVAAEGTVADASPGGFTVVTSAGTRVPVTTSSGTNVTLLHASRSQLRTGESTFAVGRARPDGTLAAITVVQPVLRGSKLNWQVKGCSPASVDTAITTAVIAAG